MADLVVEKFLFCIILIKRKGQKKKVSRRKQRAPINSYEFAVLGCESICVSLCPDTLCKNVFYLNNYSTICRDIISSGSSQELIRSLRHCLNVLLLLSVTGNFTTFRWILPESGPMEYLLGVLGKSTVIKAT